MIKAFILKLEDKNSSLTIYENNSLFNVKTKLLVRILTTYNIYLILKICLNF